MLNISYITNNKFKKYNNIKLNKFAFYNFAVNQQMIIFKNINYSK